MSSEKRRAAPGLAAARDGRDARERWMADRHGGDGDGWWIEGLRLALAARAAGLAFTRVAYAPEFFSDTARAAALVAALTADGARCERLVPRDFSRLSYKADGIVARVRYVAPPLDAVLARRGVIVVLDGLSDPGNIGAVVRTANAWCAAGVVAIDGHAKLAHEKCVRASMGALFHTPTCAASRDEVLAALGARALTVLDPAGSVGWPASLLDPAGSLVVVLGNEKSGVDPVLAARAAQRLAIPTSGFVDSLNVSNAAAVVLWEAYREASSLRRATSGGAS